MTTHVATRPQLGPLGFGAATRGGLLESVSEAAHDDSAEAPAEASQRALRIRAICGRFDIGLRAATIGFPQARPAVAPVLPAVRSVGQLEQGLGTFRQPIPPEVRRD